MSKNTSPYLQIVVLWAAAPCSTSVSGGGSSCYHLHDAIGLCKQKMWSRSGGGGDGGSRLGQSGLQDYTVSKPTKLHIEK
jgi:hypothetical protein